MSDNRSQMTEGGRKARAFYGEGGAFPFSQENESDRRRRERSRALFSGNYAEYERLGDDATWTEKNDADVLAKQRDDLRSDAKEATWPDRAKSATVAEVSRLQQSRAKGQKFRSDTRPATARISTENRSGDDGHEYLDSPGDWNKQRQL